MRKILVPQNIHEKKFQTHKIPTRQNFEPTKYKSDKILKPRNTTRKNFGPTKYKSDKILEPRNTTRKNFGPTKYARRYNGTIALDPQNPQQHAIHLMQHTLYYIATILSSRDLSVMLMSAFIWSQVLLIMEKRLCNIF